MFRVFLAKCSFLEEFFKNCTEKKKEVEIEQNLASFENTSGDIT